MSKNELHEHESMRRGDTLVSQNGDTEFRFQNDGNLCIYFKGIYVWGAATQDDGPTQQGIELRVLPDGNLVLYRSDGSILWQINKSGHDGQNIKLIVQDDCNVCMYGNDQYIWGTQTNSIHLYRKVVFVNMDYKINYPVVQDAYSNIIWDGGITVSDNKYATDQGDQLEMDFASGIIDHSFPGKPIHLIRLGLRAMNENQRTLPPEQFVFDPNCQDVQWIETSYGNLTWLGANWAPPLSSYTFNLK